MLWQLLVRRHVLSAAVSHGVPMQVRYFTCMRSRMALFLGLYSLENTVSLIYFISITRYYFSVLLHTYLCM